MTAALFPVANWALPLEINVPMDGVFTMITPLVCYLCTVAGLWGGCLIGFITEYYTSHSYTPVREVARATETGAATNIIYGLALGYQSAIAPVCILSFIIFLALKTAGMYGVALAALGMLSTLSTCLAIDVYGPISDNAGGIAEMVELPSSVRDKTDALDAAGNTTAAIGPKSRGCRTRRASISRSARSGTTRAGSWSSPTTRRASPLPPTSRSRRWWRRVPSSSSRLSLWAPSLGSRQSRGC
jgi:Na+/H+-translocating membrane pyrophosphatase